ncbi:MAG: hypothetical protein HY735_16160 [Verrucomicrobia bacterium]|nr:hypothetical protein [Verrucomicrobiota bacterium]
MNFIADRGTRGMLHESLQARQGRIKTMNRSRRREEADPNHGLRITDYGFDTVRLVTSAATNRRCLERFP